MTGAFGPWSDGIEPAERRARCRALRALAMLIIGQDHELVRLLAGAEHDAAALAEASAALDRLGALPRRRLLCAYAEVARQVYGATA